MSTQADHVDAALQYLRDVIAGTAKPDATRIAAARAIIPSADADDPDALLYLAQVVAGDEVPNRDRVAAARILAPGVEAEPPPTSMTRAYLSAGTGHVLGVQEAENPSAVALLTYVYDGEGFPAHAEDDLPAQADPAAAEHGLELDGPKGAMLGSARTGLSLTETEQRPALRADVYGNSLAETTERDSLMLPVN
jgi:hypothetical protein